jgi:hypothetical protein
MYLIVIAIQKSCYINPLILAFSLEGEEAGTWVMPMTTENELE